MIAAWILALVSAAAPPSSEPAAEVLVPVNARWRYYLGSKPPPDGWLKSGFDVSKWKEGEAPLGYGPKFKGTRIDPGKREDKKDNDNDNDKDKDKDKGKDKDKKEKTDNYPMST